MPRVLAVGDIHGCATALDALLAAVSVGPEDTVVLLGDYVDRGPDSRGVLDRLLALRSRCHLVALHGNHDQMMLDSRDDAQARAEWRQVGRNATINSYGSLTDVPAAHWDFLQKQCVEIWEADSSRSRNRAPDRESSKNGEV